MKLPIVLLAILMYALLRAYSCFTKGFRKSKCHGNQLSLEIKNKYTLTHLKFHWLWDNLSTIFFFLETNFFISSFLWKDRQTSLLCALLSASRTLAHLFTELPRPVSTCIFCTAFYFGSTLVQHKSMQCIKRMCKRDDVTLKSFIHTRSYYTHKNILRV